ncbi:MAG TPA: hypothetical protein VGL85_11240 [Phenylobacterium sp.]
MRSVSLTLALAALSLSPGAVRAAEWVATFNGNLASQGSFDDPLGLGQFDPATDPTLGGSPVTIQLFYDDANIVTETDDKFVIATRAVISIDGTQQAILTPGDILLTESPVHGGGWLLADAQSLSNTATHKEAFDISMTHLPIVDSLTTPVTYVGGDNFDWWDFDCCGPVGTPETGVLLNGTIVGASIEPAPEPASWALMTMGFLTMAAAMRSRRHAVKSGGSSMKRRHGV